MGTCENTTRHMQILRRKSFGGEVVRWEKKLDGESVLLGRCLTEKAHVVAVPRGYGILLVFIYIQRRMQHYFVYHTKSNFPRTFQTTN